MTEHQRLFLAQARTDLAVFELLESNAELPACHALHYLQMATEMLGKAYAWKYGRPRKVHRAFVSFMRSLSTNGDARKTFGYEGRSHNWRHVIRKSVPLAERVEDLAPSLAGDGPNPGYPWPQVAPITAPAEYTFGLWNELRGTATGRQFVNFVSRLFAVAEVFL